jgi:hypothetical protein
MELNEHIALLQEEVEGIVQTIKDEFMDLPLDQLNWKKSKKSWSILECIEHLNRYSFYYQSRLKMEMSKLPAVNNDKPIKFSWLGKKNVNMVRPGNIRKFKTLRRMNPMNDNLSREVFSEFLSMQDGLVRAISKLNTVNVNRRKIRIESFRLVKMGIGETVVFLVEHQKRHINQALRVKELLTNAKPKQAATAS